MPRRYQRGSPTNERRYQFTCDFCSDRFSGSRRDARFCCKNCRTAYSRLLKSGNKEIQRREVLHQQLKDKRKGEKS